MKKILVVGFVIVLSLVLLTGCGTDDVADETNNATSAVSETQDQTDDAATTAESAGVLSPPAWLIGEWVPEEQVIDGQDVVVTENNVTFNGGSLDIEWQVKNAGGEASETTDGDTYTILYSAGGYDFTYTFTKQSENAIALRAGIGDEPGTDVNFVRK
ncbi:MAG: hypothetical protein FWE87_01060 [Coriobacteriia bacterium]|nr:hypothetical protein [Coriobacteriia bacterium]